MTEHRVTSTYHSSSDVLAETAVKSGKQLLLDIPGQTKMVFGRPIRDFLPIKPGKFSPAKVWVDTTEKRELTLRERVLRGEQRVDHVTLGT